MDNKIVTYIVDAGGNEADAVAYVERTRLSALQHASAYAETQKPIGGKDASDLKKLANASRELARRFAQIAEDSQSALKQRAALRRPPGLFGRWGSGRGWRDRYPNASEMLQRIHADALQLASICDDVPTLKRGRKQHPMTDWVVDCVALWRDITGSLPPRTRDPDTGEFTEPTNALLSFLNDQLKRSEQNEIASTFFLEAIQIAEEEARIVEEEGETFHLLQLSPRELAIRKVKGRSAH